MEEKEKVGQVVSSEQVLKWLNYAEIYCNNLLLLGQKAIAIHKDIWQYLLRLKENNIELLRREVEWNKAKEKIGSGSDYFEFKKRDIIHKIEGQLYVLWCQLGSWRRELDLYERYIDLRKYDLREWNIKSEVEDFETFKRKIKGDK